MDHQQQRESLQQTARLARTLRDVAPSRRWRPDLPRTNTCVISRDCAVSEQPYGIRDCAVRDPAGTMIRIQELS
jgi:hypothetical protein